MKNELFTEMLNVLTSAIVLMCDRDEEEFYHRTCAIEMNEALTDDEVDLLETMKQCIANLVRE